MPRNLNLTVTVYGELPDEGLSALYWRILRPEAVRRGMIDPLPLTVEPAEPADVDREASVVVVSGPAYRAIA